MQDQKNIIIAIVVSIAILLGFQLLFPPEQPPVSQQQAATQQGTAGQGSAGTSPGIVAPPDGVAPALPGTAPAPGVVRQEVVSSEQRVEIVSDSVRGSIRLRGGRVDDLILNEYRETLDPESPNIELLSPSDAPKPYFADFGWVSGSKTLPVPTSETPWRVKQGSVLSPSTPVVLEWDNGQGLVFERHFALDEFYMITITQKVRNSGTDERLLYPYGLVSRSDTPATAGFFILHEGLIGVLNNELREIDYDDLQDDGKVKETSKGGWLGITDKYWLVALVPDQNLVVDTKFAFEIDNHRHRYQTDFRGPGVPLAPGEEITNVSRLFAGAKRTDVLELYNKEDPEGFGNQVMLALGLTTLEEIQRGDIINFDLAIDWGWFYWITKWVFFNLLHFFYTLVGNYGVSILIVTLLVKLVFFPLANKSYRSMSEMKKLQPEMMAIRERCGDDKMKLQQEIMALYKKNKVNPASGCLPILIQIPVFFALYKVLFVTIEMRHAPFFGWIQDLSAPDPTSLFNLFGILPYDVPSLLMIGIWPLIMGATMFFQQKLNPPPPDPTQAKILMFLPVVFTIFLASFPAGLVIYWAWNNTLSVLQQYVIMKRMGVPIGNAGAPKKDTPKAANDKK